MKPRNHATEGASAEAQLVNLPLVPPSSYPGVLVWALATLLLSQLSGYMPGKATSDDLSLGLLPIMWETRVEFLTLA